MRYFWRLGVNSNYSLRMEGNKNSKIRKILFLAGAIIILSTLVAVIVIRFYPGIFNKYPAPSYTPSYIKEFQSCRSDTDCEKYFLQVSCGSQPYAINKNKEHDFFMKIKSADKRLFWDGPGLETCPLSISEPTVWDSAPVICRDFRCVFDVSDTSVCNDKKDNGYCSSAFSKIQNDMDSCRKNNKTDAEYEYCMSNSPK